MGGLLRVMFETGLSHCESSFQTTKCKPRTPGIARSSDRHGNHMGIEKEKVSSRPMPHVNICD